MLVASVVEAYPALANRPAARPVALEVAFYWVHLINGLPESLSSLSRLSRIYPELNSSSSQDHIRRLNRDFPDETTPPALQDWSYRIRKFVET